MRGRFRDTIHDSAVFSHMRDGCAGDGRDDDYAGRVYIRAGLLKERREPASPLSAVFVCRKGVYLTVSPD